MADYIEKNIQGKVVPISTTKITRFRTKPNVFGTVLNSYSNTDFIEVDIERYYLNSISSEYVTAGDMWVHVFRINGTSVDGWMAVKHQRINPPTICNSFYTQVNTEQPENFQIVGAIVTLRYEDGSLSEPFTMKVE